MPLSRPGLGVQQPIAGDRAFFQPKVDAVAARLLEPTWYWLFALLAALFYVASSLYISFHRLLWFDEIFTAIAAREPDVSTMWESVKATQQNPPLYFLITRAFDHIFSHADIALRIPSALALGAGFLVIFDIVRRLTDGFYGLIALSLLSTTFVTYYGYEARPYAIYFMLTAIALWLWMFTEENSKTSVAGFGALFLFGEAIHYYFVLCLVPFGILALTQRRIFHPKLIAGGAGAVCSLAILYSQILGNRGGAAAGSFAPPTTFSLQAVYWQFLPNTILPLVVIALGVLIWSRFHDRFVPAMSQGERLSWMFLAIPLAAYVIGHLVNNIFLRRYVMGTLPGLVVAAVCLLWRHCKESRPLSVTLLLVLGGFGVSQQLRALHHIDHIRLDQDHPLLDYDHQEQTRIMLSLEDTFRREGKRYLVITRPELYLETWYYSKHRDLYWHFTTEPGILAKYAPVHYLSAKDIVVNARETALLTQETFGLTFELSALAQELDRAGHRLRVRFAAENVYYIE